MTGMQRARRASVYRNFYNMSRDSVKGQSPQTTTFPHFFHILSILYILAVFLP